MKTTLQLLFMWVISFPLFLNAQTTIGIQDFETTPAAPTLGFTATGGANSTGNGLFPNDPKFVSGSQGYEINNSIETLTFDVLDASAYTGVNLSFRLASFALTSGNGADGADNVQVEISTDGGATWSNEIQINGNNNAKWSFASGTGVAAAAYDGDNNPTNFAPAGGGFVTTDGYSTVSVNGLPAVATLRVRITLDNNSGNELWVIDDVEIEGTLSATNGNIGFDNPTASDTEGNTASIPITLSGATVFPVTMDVIINSIGTAEVGDFLIATTITFNSNSTENLSIFFAQDVDFDDEDFIIELSEQTSTGVNVTQATNDVTIIDDDVCAITATNFSPSSAPIGAEITITGTGFSAGSTVTIGGVAASLNFVDATTLIAIVPATAVSGDIIVTESACDQTLSGYTLIEQSGSCGSNYSDLIISEVYDADGGSLGYVEIFNGTGAAINLSDYRIDRFASLTATLAQVYSFPALVINDGQVLLGKISTSADAAGVTSDFTFGTTTGGINADDRLELVLISSGAVIDDWHDDAVPGTNGYTYTRNTTILGPNPTYTASEWTGSGTESIADLGIFNVVFTGGTPTINTQPTDISACDLNLAVTATAASGTLTYQWFFNENDGVAVGWTAVSGGAFPNATVAGETTDNLTITGTMNDYDGYQFYCLVTEAGSCNVPTEAVQYELATERFYRSRADGNWSDANSWEVANSAAGPWAAACSYPIATNSDYIHITSGFTIDTDIDLTADELVVEVGGTLTINNGSLLSINDGIGVDLQIQGTYIDNGTSGNGTNFSTNGGTWTIASAATIIKTRNSSVNQYRDNYDAGMANMTADANWIYRYTGVGSVSVSTLNTFYPNLFFENTAGGDYDFNGTGAFNGASGFATVLGNLNIGTTGIGGVDLFNENTNATQMTIMGDLNIGGNGAAEISRFVNNHTGNIGTGLLIMGDLNIDTNGEMDFSDGINGTPDGTLTLMGDWLDLNASDGFRQGESTVEFTGTSSTSILATTIENFHNMVMNKTAGATLSNLSDTDIQNDLNFVSGIIDNTAGARFRFESAATVSGTVSDASHVNGPVNKITDNTAVSNFSFPTGKNGRLGLIGIETRFNLGEEFMAEYYDTGYGTYNVNAAELDHVSRIEWWELDDVNNLGENALVTLHWRAHSDVVSVPDLRVAHFYTEAPSVVDQWEREGNSPVVAGGSTVSAGSLTSAYVTSFSPFTLADIRLNGGSLPLDLLYFEAEKVESTAELTWQVANDRAGDRHCIERSANAQEFITLGCIDATQDQATANYLFTDETPLSGDNYYRIAHTDIDGELNHSPLRVLNFESKDFVNIYPNPVQDVLNIDFPQATEAINLEIIDALGRVVLFKVVDQTAKNIQINTSDLAAGHYLLRIKINQQTTRIQKFEKK